MLDKIVQSSIEPPTDIISKIYDIKNNEKTVKLRTNVNGWQSKQYQKVDEIPWAYELAKQCLSKLNLPECRISHLWFNINPTGAYHTWHSHGGAHYVAVCYIRVPKNSGNIEFKHNNILKQIEPADTLLVVIPEKLEHRVLINESNEDRITMAFNLRRIT